MLKIPRFKLHISPAEISAITESFEKGQLISGPHVKRFESRLATLFKKKYCTLTLNGFSSLLLAILTIGTKNKRVLVPAISTCYSFVNAIKASGNKPIFVDVEKDTANIDVEEAYKLSKKEKFDLVITPNHFGIPSNVSMLKKLGVPVIEDAAQSFFTNLNTSSNADILILSFYPTKMINAIDGGAILTDNEILGLNVQQLSTYRDQLNPESQTRYNFSIPNLHASVGLKVLDRIEDIKNTYNYIIHRYSSILSSLKMEISYLGSKYSSKTLLKQFILRFKNQELRNHFIIQMAKKGIICSKELIPLTEMGSFKNAQELIASTCSLPVYEMLSEDEINYVITEMEKAINNLEN